MGTPAEQALELKNKGNGAIAKKDWAVFSVLLLDSLVYTYLDGTREVNTDLSGRLAGCRRLLH